MNTLQAQVGPCAWHLSHGVIWQRQPFCWEPPNAGICGSFRLGWSGPLEKAALFSLRNINLAAGALEASWNKGTASLLPCQLHLMTLSPESLRSVLRRTYFLPSVGVREPVIWPLRSEEGIWESNWSLCGSSTPPVFSPNLPFHLQRYLFLPIPSLFKALQPKLTCAPTIPLPLAFHFPRAFFSQSYLHVFFFLLSLFPCYFRGVSEGNKHKMFVFNLLYLTESPFSTFLASCALSLLHALLVRVVYTICSAFPMPFLGLEYLWHLVCLENSQCPSPGPLLDITGSLFCVL